MRILVCVKQVPDMAARFRPNGAGTWYGEEDLVFRMNEYDENAVEQAIQVKERLGGAPEVTALSIGPARVTEALRKALAMGCDRALHVPDDAAAERDPWQIASIIARVAQDRGFDLVLTGMQSQDRGSAQVGPFVAALLGFSCATTVVAFELGDGRVRVKRELEGGARSALEVALPAVVTCQLGLNVPRYPTLPNIMKAKKKPLDAVAPGGEPADARAATARFFEPRRRAAGQVIEGALDDVAARLATILKERASVA
ncbi:MAG TPA: electron transfer flavoprotein subunit beta/FixA family protein [Anaeromyxobacteraceae bacterium]|nr:electron transfer flavoprotein subunit beta/FixA family protein [Anaeromyxobacteraceae bacterium]